MGVRINCATGEVAQIPDEPAVMPVPESVTRYQFKAALRALNSGKAAQLKAYILTLPDAEQEEWNERRVFFRDSDLINDAAAALNVSANAVDQLFRNAAGIED